MLNINYLKDHIKAVIINKLSPIEDLISITFVGSFESSTDLSLVSDIDIVIIVDKLSLAKFKEVEAAVSSINGLDIGLNDYSIKLNMTFGPLKFKDEKVVVFHIMVYDIEGHRKHVLESPFTCLDWEYFPAAFGKNLSEIYPASGVQMEDLIGSRRGLEAYLDDLKNQVISYREYDFSTEVYTEKKHIFQIDDKHKKEYAYHIIKFLQLNLIKILFQENKRYSIFELTELFSSLNTSFKVHADLLIELHKWKYENQEEPSTIFERLEFFIKDLSGWLNDLNLQTLSFFRHGYTKLNDGSFLGVGRNPGILKKNEINCIDYYDIIYTGTLRRTIETGKLLKGKEFFQDPLLNEIDYGLVEGMKMPNLIEKYPEIVEAWERKEDPKFPNGENQMDVFDRLQSFIGYRSIKHKTAVVTHKVVLRALLGNSYKQPVHNWHKMEPNYLEAHDFHVFNGTLIPKLSKLQQRRYKDQIVGYEGPVTKYGVFWIPDQELTKYVEYWKNRLRDLEPDATYLNHPVHNTIFLFYANEDNESKIITSIKNQKIKFTIESSRIFENDLVSQGDTLSIGLLQTPTTVDFQVTLAGTLLNYIKKPIPYKFLWQGQYKESYERYGFPFVGSHWIPHITIASVRGDGKKLINEFKSTTVGFINKEISGNLALYKISGESHQLVHSWK